MTINFKVRNMTIEAVPYFDSIRQGSEDFLRVAFEFDETWDEFKTKYIYFASEGYAEFFELNGNEHDVPKYYAAQEYFAIQLSGHNGTAKIPTNKIVVTLDPSGEIWTSEPPESMAEGIQQLIDTAEAAKSKADEASNQIKDIVDGKTCFKSICADVIKIGTEATINCEKREGNFATIRVADQSGDGGAIIRGIAAPIVSNDAATKNYVDKTVENAKVKTDATLSKEGIAADAKAVGEKLRELEDKSTKIPIITDTSGMKDGDMAVLVSEDGDNVPEPDYGNIPGGGVPDGDYVTDEEMKAYVEDAVGKLDIPTVPEWAKAKEKPVYTATEIGCQAVVDGEQCDNVDDALQALANRSVGGGGSSDEWEFIGEFNSGAKDLDTWIVDKYADGTPISLKHMYFEYDFKASESTTANTKVLLGNPASANPFYTNCAYASKDMITTSGKKSETGAGHYVTYVPCGDEHFYTVCLIQSSNYTPTWNIGRSSEGLSALRQCVGGIAFRSANASTGLIGANSTVKIWGVKL